MSTSDQQVSDERWMAMALAQAEKSVGVASPNPAVGCVLVRDGEAVGDGFHIYDNFDHAEVVALRQAASRAQGSTAYVTLEPCSHHGRTAPCADALIQAGVARVVAATLDPNPQVAGRGIARLRAAGIATTIGVCQSQARVLNDAFAKFIQTGLPFVTLKAALSLDGKLAPPPAQRTPKSPRWLTGELARAEVQRLRHASDAILAGIGTVLADDPALTDRTGLPRRRPLLRIVLDSSLRLPLDSKLARTANADVLVFCAHAASPENQAALEAKGIRIERIGQRSAIDLQLALARLAELRILSVLVEGGSKVNGAFLGQKLVDKLVLFYAPIELGTDAIPFAEGVPSLYLSQLELEQLKTQSFGEDACVGGYLNDSWAADIH